MKTTAEDSKLLFSTSLLLVISSQCVAETPRAQCGGGIIINPGFDHSIDGLTKGMLCSFTAWFQLSERRTVCQLHLKRMQLS
ncbi:hypothetical protein AAHE18_06G153700 [Arachis hypogaea]